VHPLFYSLALKIAQLKTNRMKNSISSFQRMKKKKTSLSQEELENIFKTDTSATLVQVAPDFSF
jgi:hypothetical protein